MKSLQRRNKEWKEEGKMGRREGGKAGRQAGRQAQTALIDRLGVF